MNEEMIQALKEKNNKLINMVIERAKRDFPEDIAIIGLTGSFNTGDFYEKSDLDLIIINDTDRGWEISKCFILGDVGYDIYCTPWDTRIEAAANLESTRISNLLDMKVLYCAKPEYMERLNGYRQKALDALAKPIGRDCIERAKHYIDCAKVEYTNALLTSELGRVRYAVSGVIENIFNAITSLNNTYFRKGIKRYLEEIATYKYKPKQFEQSVMAVIDGKTVNEMRTAALQILQDTNDLYEEMYNQFIQKVEPTYDNICGIYEELWCNYRNKMIKATTDGDVFYAYYVARGIQDYLDEMTQIKGMKKFDIMKYFDCDNLLDFKEAFMKIMDEYLEVYHSLNRKVEQYETFEALYASYMSRK